jgi:hypothetical protein
VNQDQIFPTLNRLANDKGSPRELCQKVIDLLRAIRNPAALDAADTHDDSDAGRQSLCTKVPRQCRRNAARYESS